MCSYCIVHIRTYVHVLFSVTIGSSSVSTLKALDACVISDEEIVENLPMSGRFAAFSKEMRLRRIYQLCPKVCSVYVKILWQDNMYSSKSSTCS